MDKRVFKNVAYGAILVALGVGLGYALAWIPNVELVSLTAALAGYLLGGIRGAFVGALTFLLYSFFSPYGMPPPQLWVAQGIGGAVIGMSGATFKKWLEKPLFAAAIGIIVTLLYDIITNAAGYFAFPTGMTFAVYLVGGIAFAIIHIASNGAIFAILFPILTKKICKMVEKQQ